MAVYVDNARIAWNGWRMSHLFADTEEELHEFAERLGLKREWFQPRGGRKSRHYDVTDSKREEAFALGAVALDYPPDVAEFIAGREVFAPATETELERIDREERETANIRHGWEAPDPAIRPDVSESEKRAIGSRAASHGEPALDASDSETSDSAPADIPLTPEQIAKAESELQMRAEIHSSAPAKRSDGESATRQEPSAPGDASGGTRVSDSPGVGSPASGPVAHNAGRDGSTECDPASRSDI